MDVSNIHIQSFKSLYDVNCDFGHFTVITGPNGSGKSNLAEALNFLGEVYDLGIEMAIGRAGGYDNIAHRRTRRAKRPVTFAVTCVLDAEDFEGLPRHFEEKTRVPRDLQLTITHEFAIRALANSGVANYRVDFERISVFREGRSIARIERSKDGEVSVQHDLRTKFDKMIFDPIGDSKFVNFIETRSPWREGLTDTFARFVIGFSVAFQGLARTRVFQLSPGRCREAGVPTPNVRLGRYGENLPAAADYLLKQDGEGWQKIVSAMRSIMPQLGEITVSHSEDRRLALKFREQGLGRPWNAGEVSDGTIQALALFVALYDRRSPLLVIEEPENSVHPWILRQFIDLCRQNVGKQIIMTTHSPILLDYVSQRDVRIMWNQDGASHYGHLEELAGPARDLISSGEIDIFAAYDSGVIREAVPRGLAHAPLDDEPEHDVLGEEK
ncbi:AAA family ATPase [Yinghuangia sp. YIM S09857]|uniref:AAA family ATPase n=1 Tax=Yinghuangia sp. YIM S09857 TaxID=3436929 RepID=UPI003F529937